MKSHHQLLTVRENGKKDINAVKNPSKHIFQNYNQQVTERNFKNYVVRILTIHLSKKSIKNHKNHQKINDFHDFFR